MCYGGRAAPLAFEPPPGSFCLVAEVGRSNRVGMCRVNIASRSDRCGIQYCLAQRSLRGKGIWRFPGKNPPPHWAFYLTAYGQTARSNTILGRCTTSCRAKVVCDLLPTAYRDRAEVGPRSEVGGVGPKTSSTLSDVGITSLWFSPAPR